MHVIDLRLFQIHQILCYYFSRIKIYKGSEIIFILSELSNCWISFGSKTIVCRCAKPVSAHLAPNFYCNNNIKCNRIYYDHVCLNILFQKSLKYLVSSGELSHWQSYHIFLFVYCYKRPTDIEVYN